MKKIQRAVIAVALASAVVGASAPASAYQTGSGSASNCSVSVGAGINYAGQKQAAVSSGDTDCNQVIAGLYNGGSYVGQSSDSSHYFSAVKTTSAAANNGLLEYQADNGTWGGQTIWF